MTGSQSKKIAEDQSDKILQKTTQLFEPVQSLETQMDSSVKTLETHMKEGFWKEGLQRKQEYESLEKKIMIKMEDGFKNEENARQLVQRELAVMKDV